MDLGITAPSYFEGHNDGSTQVGGSAQDAWFPEGTQAAAEWDQEMNDLLETLEGHKPENVAPVVPGGVMGAESTMGGNEWAWEAALVDI